MKHAAFLSMDTLDGFVSDDELAIDPLREYGWNVTTVSWRQPEHWSRFDMVIIRTPWDYHHDAQKFLQVLDTITTSGTSLQNTIELVKWNIQKTYLRDLQQKSNHIVPTLWCEAGTSAALVESFFDELHSDEIILKPVVSANADNTFRLAKNNGVLLFDVLERTFASRPYMVQPFMRNIVSEGEYSLFYFGGEYSHAILKTPKRGDFRVQEEHGGIITPVKTDASFVRDGEKVIRSLDQIPLYARVDFVRDDENEFAVMEVELIEPALYFRMDSSSAKRFARVVHGWR